MDWYFFAGLAAGAAALVGRGVLRRSHQEAAGRASGLEPVKDLTHLPPTVQNTALWNLGDGGFESRVVFGELARGKGDVAVTAFDLETLRERRGEWAWLPVEPPFRIAGTVSVVVCEIERDFKHALFKRAGRGDELRDDDFIQRHTHVAKAARSGLGVRRSYPAEMPDLPVTPLELELPEGWRVYGKAGEQIAELVQHGFGETLAHASRRDLVVELLGGLVVVYPAARDVVGADAFADLTTTALEVVDGVLAASAPLSPRGVLVS